MRRPRTLGLPSQYDHETVEVYGRLPVAAAECKSVRDPKELGRRLENKIMDLLAVNPRCKGVEVILDWHEKFDGKLNPAAIEIQEQKDHWNLFLDYIPGSKVHSWSLFPASSWNNRASNFGKGRMVSGEGTAPQIADQICTVVTGQGASLR